jgi:hypothetical protein
VGEKGTAYRILVVKAKEGDNLEDLEEDRGEY